MKKVCTLYTQERESESEREEGRGLEGGWILQSQGRNFNRGALKFAGDLQPLKTFSQLCLSIFLSAVWSVLAWSFQ